MRLDWYTLMYNEEDIIPFVLDYWKKIIADGIDLHVTVFDNYSTDYSVSLLKPYPWIEIMHFKTDGQNDIIQTQIKNNCWKLSRGKADFVCVCDFDEILWGDIKGELQKMKDGGYNVMGTQWYAFCGDKFPNYEEGKYLHQLVKRGYKQYINHMEEYKHLGKFMIIDPNITNYTGWSVGNHILYSIHPYLKLYVSDKVTAFHINKGLGENYFVEKRKRMGERLSEDNKSHGMCVEYNYPEEQSRKEYQDYVKESIDISNL